MDKGHDLKKGHHEEAADGKAKAPTHSGVNPQHAEADAAHERQVKEDIAAVKKSEEVVKDQEGKDKPDPDSHTSHKKHADDTVYNFVRNHTHSHPTPGHTHSTQGRRPNSSTHRSPLHCL